MEQLTAVDRWHRTQVACKIVNLSNLDSNHVVSHHYRKTADGDRADVRAKPWEDPRAQGFRREIEIIKGLSHVSLLESLQDFTKFDRSQTLSDRYVFSEHYLPFYYCSSSHETCLGSPLLLRQVLQLDA